MSKHQVGCWDILWGYIQLQHDHLLFLCNKPEQNCFMYASIIAIGYQDLLTMIENIINSFGCCDVKLVYF